MSPLAKKSPAGFTLVEVLVAAALMLVVFGALFASVSYSLNLIGNSQSKLSALSLATDRIEFIRSLPYNDVGTIAGIPSGTIPQNSTTTLNGFVFTERVLIEYVDAPEDGLGASDTNGILADFKQVKVEYTWRVGSSTPQSLFLISQIVPRSIETSAGGGTIRVRVDDYLSAPMAGASVRLVNNTTTSTIDVTRLTDATGFAFFAGAPAASNYEVYVSRPGFSSDQTYLSTTTLPISVFPPITLLESDITDVVFAIDRLSDLTVRSYSSFTENTLTQTFVASSSVASSSSNVEVTGGQLVLTNTAGVYQTSGTAIFPLQTPSPLELWGGLYMVATTPLGTTYTLQFYANDDVSSLLPDSVLPGNSAGIAGPFVSLRSLDVATYPSLRYTITLRTSNTAATPQITSASLWYAEATAPRAAQSMQVVGNKVIGELGNGTPIPKFTTTELTDGDGVVELNDIEWDAYTASIGALDMAMVCTSNPINVAPNTQTVMDVVFVSNVASTLRINVMAGGVAIPGASVTLSRPGFSDTKTTGVCGQTFFNTGLTDAGDYTIQANVPGFGIRFLNAQSIAGDTIIDVTL